MTRSHRDSDSEVGPRSTRFRRAFGWLRAPVPPGHPSIDLGTVVRCLPSAAIFGLVHAALFGRFFPELGRGAITLGILCGLGLVGLDLLSRRLAVWAARHLGPAGEAGLDGGGAGRAEALSAVVRIYPLLLAVQEYHDIWAPGFNATTRNFLVLESWQLLTLCHLTLIVGLGVLALGRCRLSGLKTAVLLLVAANFVAYFFREQGEYFRVHVVRTILEMDSIEGPWRQRVLVPLVMNGLIMTGLVSKDALFAALFVLSVPTVFFTLLFLDDALAEIGPGGFWLAALSPLLLVFGFDVVYVTTLPEILFAALLLRYAWKGQLVPCLVVLALGMLNRESFVIFGLIIPLFLWERGGFRITRLLVFACGAFLAVVIAVKLGTWIALGPFRVMEWHWEENLGHIRHYLETLAGLREHRQSPYHHTNFVYAVNKPLVVFASLPLVAMIFGRRGPRALWLATALVIPAYLGLILVGGMLNESRMLFVTLPLVLATLHGALVGGRVRPMALTTGETGQGEAGQHTDAA